MVSVNFNASATRLHTIAVATERKQNRSLEQLASGERLRTASDDPAALVLANQMRYQLRGMNRAVDNISEGVALVQTAEAALGEINTLLTRMRTLTLSAANEGANDINQFSALQTEFDAAIDSITRIAEQTRFGSLPILQGAFQGNRLDEAARAFIDEVRLTSPAMPGGVLKGSAMTMDLAGPVAMDRSRVQAVLTTGPLAGVPTLSDTLQGLYQNGVQFTAVNGPVTLTGQKGTVNLTVTPTTTVGDFLAMVNAGAGETGILAAFDRTTGQISLQSALYGATPLEIDSPAFGAGIGLLDTAPGAPGTNALLVAGTDRTIDYSYLDARGILRTMTLTQDHSRDGGLAFTNLDGGPEPAPPFTGFEPGAVRVFLADRGDAAVIPTAFIVPAGTYTAVRESTTAIQVGPKSSERTLIDIPDMRASALGHTANMAGDGFASIQSLRNRGALINGFYDQALRLIDAAVNETTRVRGDLGAIQANSLESGQESLRVAYENLTGAESLLRDTDYAKEMAEFTRLDIVAQATMSMLAQANQLPQRVLELLRQQ